MTEKEQSLKDDEVALESKAKMVILLHELIQPMVMTILVSWEQCL